MNSPGCDLFIAGFPCQPFSAAGSGHGVLDARGTVIYRLIAWIDKHQPTLFVLENVRGLVDRHTETFHEILVMLCNLGSYEVSWGILGAHTHGSVPQHRERVFIVGILRCKKKSDFTWPRAMPLTTSLSDFILEEEHDGLHENIAWPRQKTQKRNLAKVVEKVVMQFNENPLCEKYIADIGCGPTRAPCVMKELCPCLTVAAASSSRYWLTRKNRFINTEEIIRLMGVMPSELPSGVVSDGSLRSIAGNAIAVPVLARVLNSLLAAVDL